MLLGNLCSDVCTRVAYLVGTFAIAVIVYRVVYKLKDKFNTKTIIKKKQDEREDDFLKLEIQHNFTEEHEKILQLSEEDLIEKLQQRQLKAVTVLEAFTCKALRISRELNCVTDFVPKAMEWATQLDQRKEIKGPLHGVPISIKDNCNVEGMDSTLGLAKRLYKPANDHSVIVKVLLDLGAVPFCKTNVPQTLLSFDCTNPVFGVTSNHLNSELSPGGSSGGESTLIGAGGSIIGIGSDIGGSVRIPAHFSGIVGFKATQGRLSPVGFEASIPNVVGLIGVPGLLSRSTKMLTKVFSLLVEERRQQKYDPLALPIGFDHKILSSTSKLRIGYFTSLPFFPLLGDTESTVLEAKKALENQGHTLLPFQMPDTYHMFELVTEFGFADGGAHFLKNWKNEPVPRGLYFNYLVCLLPIWLRHVVATLIDIILPYFHSPRAALIMRCGARRTIDLWDRLGERKRLIEGIMTQWRRLELDLLICPTMPFPAIPHNVPAKLQSSVVYTIIFNLLDFPAGSVPFGKESGEKIESYNDEGDFMLRTGRKGARQSTNMPISVQVVGLPYEEEKVLRGMEILQSISPISTKKLQ